MKLIKLNQILNKIFTPTNLSKVIVIFIVGLTSRYLINEYLDVNVFKEYLSLVSLTFYSFYATFVVLIHELFTFFNINIIPNFIFTMFNMIKNILSYIFIEPFIYIYSHTFGKYPHIYNVKDRRSSKIDGKSKDRASIYLQSGGDYSHYFNNNYYTQQPEQSDKQYKSTQLDSTFATNPESGPSNYRVSSVYSQYSEYNRRASYYPPNTRVSQLPSDIRYSVNPADIQYTVNPADTQYNVNPGNNRYSINPVDIEYSKGRTFTNQDNIPKNSSYYKPVSNDPFIDQHPIFRSNDDVYQGNGEANTSSPKFFVIDSIEDDGNNVEYVRKTVDNKGDVKKTILSTPVIDEFVNNYQSAGNSQHRPSQLSYNTNRATVGRGLTPELNRELTLGKARVIDQLKSKLTEGFYDAAQPSTKQEITLFQDSMGTTTVGAQYSTYKNKSTITNLYIKYHDITKRKFLWNIWEKNRGNYGTYEEFKENFNPKMSIWKEITSVIKTDLSHDVRELLNAGSLSPRKQALDVSQIRRIPNSSANHAMNRTNASRYNPERLYESKRQRPVVLDEGRKRQRSQTLDSGKRRERSGTLDEGRRRERSHRSEDRRERHRSEDRRERHRSEDRRGRSYRPDGERNHRK